ncbi:DUF6037 family protein [Mixta calida]|uniref:DUF6037 family protein n=1 Tax=Mixta calida TaxID=665913 RepID=UPI0028ABD546|nr:DUF6037 family protein [Mixta calida]
MQLEGLRPLHADMKRNNVKRTQFQYRHNNVVFDVIFFTDSDPFQLLFGAIGYKCSFIFDVTKGYQVAPIITPRSAYYELCRILGLTYDPLNPFKPQNFLNHFSNHIPSTITSAKEPVALTTQSAEIVDDGDKIYFSHWRNNGDSSHVTEQNLDKTYKAFGQTISDFCRIRNISSCWSVKDKKK